MSGVLYARVADQWVQVATSTVQGGVSQAEHDALQAQVNDQGVLIADLQARVTALEAAP